MKKIKMVCRRSEAPLDTWRIIIMSRQTKVVFLPLTVSISLGLRQSGASFQNKKNDQEKLEAHVTVIFIVRNT